MIAVLASLAWCYARLLRRDVVLAAAACVGGVLLAIDPTVTMRAVTTLDYVYRETGYGLPGGIGLMLFAGALFVAIARRPSTRLLLLAYLAIGWASAFRQDFFLRGYHTVFYRDAGDDWLTYESYRAHDSRNRIAGSGRTGLLLSAAVPLHRLSDARGVW